MPVQALSDRGSLELPDEGWAAGLLTRLGTTLDGGLLRAMTFVVDNALMPAAEELPSIRASARPYLDEELQAEPRRFFAFLEEEAAPARLVGERLRRSISGGAVVARRFLSACPPFHPLDDPISSAPENQRIPVEHWSHEPERPRATILALHGFSMGGRPAIDAFALMAGEWFRRGFDVALMTLPYHGERSPQGMRFSGQAFASSNPMRANEAIRQAVSDVRQLSTWLRQRTQAPVGLLGLSLGGYVAALSAGLSDEPDFVITLVPPVDLADLARRFYERSRRLPLGEEPALLMEQHRAVYRLHSPLTHSLRVARERVMIVAGRGDRVVPPEHPHTLWTHWGRPDIHWFSGSHIAPFGRRRIVSWIAERLDRIVEE